MSSSTVVPVIAAERAGRLPEWDFFRESDADGHPNGKVMARRKVKDGEGVESMQTRPATMSERIHFMRTVPVADNEKAPQCVIKATLDEQSGDYLIRIPSQLSPLHIQPSSTDKSLVAKYVVHFPEDSLMEVGWEQGAAYHRLSGDRKGQQTLNLNMLLGLRDDMSPAK